MQPRSDHPREAYEDVRRRIVPVSKSKVPMRKIDGQWKRVEEEDGGSPEGWRDNRVFDFKDLVTGAGHGGVEPGSEEPGTVVNLNLYQQISLSVRCSKTKIIELFYHYQKCKLNTQTPWLKSKVECWIDTKLNVLEHLLLNHETV